MLIMIQWPHPSCIGKHGEQTGRLDHHRLDMVETWIAGPPNNPNNRGRTSIPRAPALCCALAPDFIGGLWEGLPS